MKVSKHTKSGMVPHPEGLALWSFLWGAGCPRFHVTAGGIPNARDVVVTSLPALLTAVEGENTGASVLTALDFQLRAGFLERWLGDGLGQTASADSARSIRADTRSLKVERWLQSAGLSTYFIGQERISSIADIARLPERGGDMQTLWEHIREGVPQERFRGDLAAVRILEGVRGSIEIPDRAKPLIACLRLGLRRLPWANRFLEKFADLDAALNEPGGREALRGLLESGVLQAWVETVDPSKSALVAGARGLSPSVAVDRIVRGLVGPAVYLVPGVKAGDYAELLELVAGDFHVLCGNPEARERIRDALFGPTRLPGAPSDLHNPPEAELARLDKDHQPNLFAWFALKLPILHLGTIAVRSADEYFEAISKPKGRSAAIRLARAGVLSLWYRRALGGSLSEELSGEVPEEAFPALCLEMGEAAPRIEVTWSSSVAKIPDGGIATFQLSLSNPDSLRAAVIEISAVTKPHRGAVSLTSHIELAPGASSMTQLRYPSPPGFSGRTNIVVGITHAGPRPVTISSKNLSVSAGSPWRLAKVIAAVVVASVVIGMIISGSKRPSAKVTVTPIKEAPQEAPPVVGPRVLAKAPAGARIFARPDETAAIVAHVRAGGVLSSSAPNEGGWVFVRLQSGGEGWTRYESLVTSPDAISLSDSFTHKTGDQLRTLKAGGLYADPGLTVRIGGFTQGERIEVLRSQGKVLVVAESDGAGGRVVAYAKSSEVGKVASTRPKPTKRDAGADNTDPVVSSSDATTAGEPLPNRDEKALNEAKDHYAGGNFKEALARAEDAIAAGVPGALLIAAMAACKHGNVDRANRYAKGFRGADLATFRSACPAPEPRAPKPSEVGSADASTSSPDNDGLYSP